MSTQPFGLALSYQFQRFHLESLPVRIGYLPTPLYQNAVNEFEASRRCNPEFAYLSGLAAMAIAMQNLYDVETPTGHRFPTSLLIMGVGGASKGKSAAGNYFLKCIEDFEKSNAPRLPAGGFLYKNTTGAALFAGLSELPTAGLVSYEGSEILNRIVRQHASDLNSLYSGESIKVRRTSTTSFSLHDARLTMLALTHRGRLQELLAKTGDNLRDIGFLSRLIVADAEDVFYPASEEATPEPYREEFSRRVMHFLERNLEAALDPEFKRTVLKFDDAAGAIWLRYTAQLNLDGQPGGRFELAPDHGMRLAQNVARVAALLHKFEGEEGGINERALYAAMALCEAASRRFMCLMVPEISDELDANFLDEWLTRNRRQRGGVLQRFIPRAELRRYGPNRMRDNAILNPLIDMLVSRGRLAQVRKNGTWYLDLMPWVGEWTATDQMQTSV